MKIETRLTLKNMRKNLKRTIYTTISIALCTFLIFTTLILVSSIRNGINEGTNIQYNDYHFIINGLSSEEFALIKDKSYIDKIYIQQNDDEDLKELNEGENPFSNTDKINIYIKYKNAKKTYKYSSNIIQTLQFSQKDAESKCSFNDKLLTVYGLMGATLDYTDSLQLEYRSLVNFSYVIDLMIVLILLVFSILFIIILYNAFLVTINERKREYAILNSIGGTEGQILKMIFLEATIMAIFGIIMGGIISFLGSKFILEMINNILAPTSFNFSLVVDIRYVIVALIIILLNIYISAIIPSVKASSTSVIDSIRNNKQIKYKKRNPILGKFLPVEGRIASINLKRNKNKYRVITILLVICMVSFISVSTYINYEKASADLVSDYDIDADLVIHNSKIDYKKILDDYTTTTGDKIEYFEYISDVLFALVEPTSAISSDVGVFYYDNDKKDINYLSNLEINDYNEKYKEGMVISLVGLNDKKYNEYINKINANYGDYIIYNTVVETEKVGEDEYTYKYGSAFNTNEIKFSLLYPGTKEGEAENAKSDYYEMIDGGELNGNFVLTDEILDGFKDFDDGCTMFVNIDTYNKIEEKIQSFVSKNMNDEEYSSGTNKSFVRVRCENVISFSDYITNIAKEQNYQNFIPMIYSLEHQEKTIYINILQLILNTIVITIIIIGMVSAINILSASLFERREEFKILSRLGATNGNINKILIYESVYMFIKALVISVIISIPILYAIVKNMENVIVLKQLLIPVGSIGLFAALLFIISLAVTLYSARIVKNK